jgi:integrase/recombinase XerD
MANVHTSVMLDTRRGLKDGTFPVKLRLTYLRQRKYFPTPYNLTEEGFAKTQGAKPRGEFKTLQTKFQAIEQKAIKVIEKLPAFSFDAFEKKFLTDQVKDDVFTAFRAHIERLTQEGRAGTADAYDCAYRSLLVYTKKKQLPYPAVTPDFLKAYEKWFLSPRLIEGRKKAKSGSLTTVGIYLRSLRAIFNDAIASGEVSPDLYPFGKRKYQIPAGRNVKKALPLSDIEKIFTYEPAHDNEARARDLWIFSYLCNGINVKDIARLKHRTLDRDKITFVRAKTERTTRQNLKPIIVVLTPEMEQIIKRWGSPAKSPDSYVFPILEKGLTPEQELAKVRQATKTINKHIKRIAEAVGIEKDITSYTARHSFSTVLKRSGAPIEYISEALGHSNLKVTESYLDSFEDNVKRQYTAQLTAFGKNE